MKEIPTRARSPYGLRGQPTTSAISGTSLDNLLANPPSIPQPSQEVVSPTPRRYSDVVAARSVSAPPDAENRRAGDPAFGLEPVEGRDSALERVAVTRSRDSALQRRAEGRREDSDPGDHQDAAEQYQGDWTEVGKSRKPHKRKRVLSDSATSSRESSPLKPVTKAPNVLTEKQMKDVNTAVASMSDVQYDNYNKRLKHLKLNLSHSTSEDSEPRTSLPVQGPSQYVEN
jgi:hypothetical protein